MIVKWMSQNDCIKGVEIECDPGEYLLISKALHLAISDNRWRKDVPALTRMCVDCENPEIVDVDEVEEDNWYDWRDLETEESE